MPNTATLLSEPAPPPAATPISKSVDDWMVPEAVEAEFRALTANRLTKLRMGPRPSVHQDWPRHHVSPRRPARLAEG